MSPTVCYKTNITPYDALNDRSISPDCKQCFIVDTILQPLSGHE